MLMLKGQASKVLAQCFSFRMVPDLTNCVSSTEKESYNIGNLSQSYTHLKAIVAVHSKEIVCLS